MTKSSLTSIIIPTYNGLHLLKPCIEAIRLYTDTPYEIIVVDNASTDGTVEYCLREDLTLISLPENIGFPAACNKGLAVSRGDSLLLLNNDCYVTPRWLTQMLSALYSAEDVGIVGPVTNYASGRQLIMAEGMDREQRIAFAESYNRSDPSKWHEVRRLVGFCMLFRRELWREIGGLDERYSPGHYEDDDYCYRTVMNGRRLLICGDTFVYHEGSASFKADHPQGWGDLVQENRRKFMDKWGQDPLWFI